MQQKQHKYAYKRIGIIFFIVIMLGFFIWYFIANQTDYIKTAKRSSYILKQVDENYLDHYLQSKNTLVVFFASWCGHCVEEENMITEYIENNPNIPVIIVSHDTSYEEIENYLMENNLNWFVIFDPDKSIRNKIDENSSGIPSLYLIDKDSNVLDKLKWPFSYEDIANFYYE
ncbi:MAG: TlpA disulfide reductase family protein [Clostridia bacterium]|nr:TlpA disulfide reductase family protein [Clostridia bacterium]